ncbi:hypothetical protein ES708_01617 [subsurface metagenome]
MSELALSKPLEIKTVYSVPLYFLEEQEYFSPPYGFSSLLKGTAFLKASQVQLFIQSHLYYM